jgi:peptide methionine sulfoxide reductase MsrB
MSNSNEKNNEQWRAALTPEEFHVCREHGTERPFTAASVVAKLFSHQSINLTLVQVGRAFGSQPRVTML